MWEPIFHISHPEALRRHELRKGAIQDLTDVCFVARGSDVKNSYRVLPYLRAARVKIDALIAELEAK